MSFLDAILRAMPYSGQHAERAWPVGHGTVSPWEKGIGHDDTRFSPESYEDYYATSNEIFSVINMRARLVSGLKLNLFYGDDADKKLANDHPAAKTYRYVNPFWTSRRLERMDELSMGIWGETCWALEPGTNSREPGEIWWLKPSRVKPATDVDNYLSGYWYWPQLGGEPIFFESHELIWFRYPNPLDEFSAMSPLGAARQAAEMGKAMMTSNAAMFENGLQIAGLITPPADKVTFSPDQAQELERALDRRFRGAKNAKKWAVLRYEAQFKPMSVTPKDAEFLGGLNMSLRQVCNAYGVPSSLLNDIEHSNMAILGELVRALWSHTLVPDTELRASEIEEQYLPRFRGGPDHAAYDYSKVEALQESATAKWEREAQAIDRGRYTVNEIRAMAGEPEVAWGSVWWAPVNKFAVTDADSKPAGPVGADGKPDALPDDERNPSNKPASPRHLVAPDELDHMAARRFLAQLNGRALSTVGPRR